MVLHLWQKLHHHPLYDKLDERNTNNMIKLFYLFILYVLLSICFDFKHWSRIESFTHASSNFLGLRNNQNNTHES